jgi:indolepyruvate ferredoxin oxidoreductase, beta subunit
MKIPNPDAKMKKTVTSIVLAGLGGQGVLRASDILANTAFASGLDVKKSEIHGMSQRGGSVTSDVRFGEKVFSPIVTAGDADYLVVLAEDQVEINRHRLCPGGILITPGEINLAALPHEKSVNVALLGVLSKHLDFPVDLWIQAIHNSFEAKLREINEQAFILSRSAV